MAGYDRPPERDDTDVIGARIAAQILDQIFIGVIAFFAGFLMVILGVAAGSAELGSTLMLLAITVFAGGYFLLLEGIWDGHTLGKKLLGIKVVKEDGSECDISASIIRNLLRIIDSILYYAVGFIFMASSDKRQRLGDRIAGTVVVRESPVNQTQQRQNRKTSQQQVKSQNTSSDKQTRNRGQAQNRQVKSEKRQEGQ